MAILQVDQVSKKFASLQAVKDLTLSLSAGEIVGFLGPNGAGKTTAMRMICGFFPPSSGRIVIDGIDMRDDPKTAKKLIGYLPETVSLYGDMRVVEYLNFVAAVKGVGFLSRSKAVKEKIEQCGLGDVSKRLIGKLSKGFKQRVGLAQALLGDPKLLILDEPTSGLDPKQISEIRSLIQSLSSGRAVLFSTHILPEVTMLCNRVVMLNKGRVLASGTVEELEAHLSEDFQIQITILGRARTSEALAILESIEGLKDINFIVSTGEQVMMTCRAPIQLEFRNVITEKLSKQGISVIEIKREQLTLEEIFLRLLK